MSINVAPATITLGQSALLSWSASGVSACTASGAWSGAQSLQGSLKVSPSSAGSFSYVLNCSVTPNGSIAQSATLTVNAMGALGSARDLERSRRYLSVRRTDLVADVAGIGALLADPSLSEPWGLAMPPALPAVIANRSSNTATSYDGTGSARPSAAPLRLQLPFAAAGPIIGAAGVVANSSDGFVVSAAGKSTPARLVWASTGGVIAAWSPEMGSGAPVVVHLSSDSAVYTGLALKTSSTPGEGWLYAADFRNARVEAFDTSFRRVLPTRTRFAFADPHLPPGYAPFGIATSDELVYVAYAQRPVPFAPFPVSGAGRGLIDVFTSSGVFITRLVPVGSMLNAPWAVAPVPDGRALPVGRALLVGNTGDGTIQAFDRESGVPLGALTDDSGAVLLVPRLHALAFGNGAAAQPGATLFFTAGTGNGAHGWYGRIDFEVAAGTAR
ncbi:MAG: TIGR03118 family protein [Gammaproteobacteria bacterium]|nr:TIGR03118 family protein [Gammaproteobacteria bacterium]